MRSATSERRSDRWLELERLRSLSRGANSWRYSAVWEQPLADWFGRPRGPCPARDVRRAAPDPDHQTIRRAGAARVVQPPRRSSEQNTVLRKLARQIRYLTEQPNFFGKINEFRSAQQGKTNRNKLRSGVRRSQNAPDLCREAIFVNRLAKTGPMPR